MRKQKIYLETTVFNHYFEPTREEYNATRKLFEEIRQGKFEAYTSILVVQELKKTPKETKRENMLNLIKEYNIPLFELTSEAKALGNLYIDDGIIPVDYRDDAFHVAVACTNDIDIIVSMNFKHINKWRTKIMTGHINAKFGYTKQVSICSAREVIDNE